jgi:hypothetical protein
MNKIVRLVRDDDDLYQQVFYLPSYVDLKPLEGSGFRYPVNSL